VRDAAARVRRAVRGAAGRPPPPERARHTSARPARGGGRRPGGRTRHPCAARMEADLLPPPPGTYEGDSDLQLERVNVYVERAAGGGGGGGGRRARGRAPRAGDADPPSSSPQLLQRGHGRALRAARRADGPGCVKRGRGGGGGCAPREPPRRQCRPQFKPGAPPPAAATPVALPRALAGLASGREAREARGGGRRARPRRPPPSPPFSLRARHHGLGPLRPLRPDLPPRQLCVWPGGWEAGWGGAGREAAEGATPRRPRAGPTPSPLPSFSPCRRARATTGPRGTTPRARSSSTRSWTSCARRRSRATVCRVWGRGERK